MQVRKNNRKYYIKDWKNWQSVIQETKSLRVNIKKAAKENKNIIIFNCIALTYLIAIANLLLNVQNVDIHFFLSSD